MRTNKLWVGLLLAFAIVGGMGCVVDTTSSGSRTCNIPGESCSSSLNCCGPGFCTGGVCDSNSYLSAGSSCTRSVECRGSLFCTGRICQ